MKLYDELEISPITSNCDNSICCHSELLDSELEIVDESFREMDSFSMEETCSLYFVCGYIAFKVGSSYASRETYDLPPESEFQLLVSRGRLCHPSEALTSFGRCCYYIFKLFVQKSDANSRCANRLSRLFLCLSDAFPYQFDSNLRQVCNRLANIFYKGFVNQQSRASFSSVPPSSRTLRKLDARTL